MAVGTQKYEIVKPVDMTWKELDALVRDATEQQARICNDFLSHCYQNTKETFERAVLCPECRRVSVVKKDDKGKTVTKEKGVPYRVCVSCGHEWHSAWPDYMAPTKVKYPEGKIYAHFSARYPRLTTAAKMAAIGKDGLANGIWKNYAYEILSGERALSTFRRDGALALGGSDCIRLKRDESGTYAVLKLRPSKPLDVCVKLKIDPASEKQARHPKAAGDRSREVVMDRMLSGQYKTRASAKITRNAKNKLMLHICYDTLADAEEKERPERIGVFFGPLGMYMAVHGQPYQWSFVDGANHFRFSARERIETGRRRQQRLGGAPMNLRAGRGRKNKLKAIEKYQQKIQDFQRTENEKQSRALVNMAQKHDAGTVCIPNLKGGFGDKMKDSAFLRRHWGWHNLYTRTEQKCKAAGIEVKNVNPRWLMERCPECGHITPETDFAFVQKNPDLPYMCPECGHTKSRLFYLERRMINLGPYIVFAENVATPDIEEIVKDQAIKQGLAEPEEELINA